MGHANTPQGGKEIKLLWAGQRELGLVTVVFCRPEWGGNAQFVFMTMRKTAVSST